MTMPTHQELPKKSVIPFPPMECKTCGRINFPMVILKNPIWLTIAKKKDLLCFECMEKALGRLITSEDLKPCPLTEGMKLGATIFARTPVNEESTNSWNTYWEERKELPYYQAVKTCMESLTKKITLESVLDIGCGGCPTATWGSFHVREAINLEPCPPIPGVELYIYDWMQFRAKPKYSLITCMQVLEHLSDEELPAFVEKIWTHARNVIISVPYKWEKGACSDHKQDPIDEAKLRKIMGRPSSEVVISGSRMVALYLKEPKL